MSTAELRESFKHIHAPQDWERLCVHLADMLDVKEAIITHLLQRNNTA